MNLDFPDSTLRSRSRNSFPCQAGDSSVSGFDDKLCQSVSIVWSFSSTLSFGMAVRISSTVLIPNKNIAPNQSAQNGVFLRLRLLGRAQSLAFLFFNDEPSTAIITRLPC